MNEDSLRLLNTKTNKNDPLKDLLTQGKKIAVVVAAAGASRRMKGKNKLFLEVAGRPVLLRTVEVFLALGEHVPVIVAVNSHDLSRAHQLFKGMSNVSVVLGGDCRQESVAQALALVGDDLDYVIVHDGARPLLKGTDLEAFIKKGLQSDALVMAVPVKDTVKKVNVQGMVTETPCREELWLAQTPQMFKRSLLCPVHAEACMEGYRGTDEAALLERKGIAVAVFPGSYVNIKITTPEDMGYAQSVLESRDREELEDGQGVLRFPSRVSVDPNQVLIHPTAELNSEPLQREDQEAQESEAEYPRAVPAMVEMSEIAPRVRIGLGYDMHALAEGRELILGGARIPHERGLIGHSDADVLTHSIMDAMLGALALGDIGKVFPDSDMMYKDICSLVLLKKVAAMVKIHGYIVCNIDAVVCAQEPRLATYIGHIRDSLAACLDLMVGQVSVKATTTEGLGPEGRKEGISAQAVVMLEKVMT